MKDRTRLLKGLVAAAAIALMAVAARPVASGTDMPPDTLDGIARLVVLPGQITLDGINAEHRILVQAIHPDGRVEDITSRARLRSTDPRVAVVREGLIKSVGPGYARVVAAANNAEVEALVTVISSDTSISFRNHVIPILTKAGCNSGACHGAAAGKNGFKLTLRGYDPELDYQVLTRQASARRINKLDPARSLILLKPSMTIPHGGGKRFEVGSHEYNVLAQWIASGMPPPKDNDPQIERIEVLPGNATLEIGRQQQLIVRAHFSDGHSEDVTRWAKYATADESVAGVTEDGRVTMTGHGETAISVWYLSRVSFARVGVPFPNKIDPEAYDRAARNNFIDGLVLAKLKQLGIAPSGPSTDSEFIRRAFLDAAGILPRPDEVAAFLNDTRPDKRARLIDELLTRPEFVDYWAYKWSDLLLVSSRKLSAKNVRAYYRWIRESVESNKPWDRFVRELVTASGSSQENGAVNYFLINRSPIEVSENFSQAFLGLSLTCARCHNHPLEKWTQKNYYEFANLFSRVTVKNGTAPGELTVFAAPAGDINHPRLGRPLAPRPLDGAPIPTESTEDRRERLAKWLGEPENQNFARTIVNRVWANFFGRGLVHPVDDLRATNPATNEDLLAELVKDFIRNNYDVKHLIRAIMNSATYQLSSVSNATNAQDDRYNSRYPFRRLPAEVILDAISQITGVPERFPGYPAGTRALQLPDTRVDSYFLTVFGRPERATPSAGERQQDPSLAQALHVINGETLNRKLTAADNIIDSLLNSGKSPGEIIEHLYLSAYSRRPTERERDLLLGFLQKSESDDREAARSRLRTVLEDFLWAALTSKEFLFNH